MFSSSLLRKVVMALSGLFLISFLALHLAINLASIFSEELYNTWSHFMGYNPVVQFVLQPILVAGVILHFVMGFVLEAQNRKAPIAAGYQETCCYLEVLFLPLLVFTCTTFGYTR